MKAPSDLSVGDIRRMANENHTEINGEWVPARPIGLDGLRMRFRLAFLVFVGRRDALRWPLGQ